MTKTVKRASKRPAGKRGLTPNSEAICSLRLYVAGQTPKSLTAIRNLKRICELHVDIPYRIEVIDLMANPHLAGADQILAIPTLVRKLPEPVRKIIGDLSSVQRVLIALDIDKRIEERHDA